MCALIFLYFQTDKSPSPLYKSLVLSLTELPPTHALRDLRLWGVTSLGSVGGTNPTPLLSGVEQLQLVKVSENSSNLQRMFPLIL